MSATDYEWLSRVARYAVISPSRRAMFLRVQKCGQTTIYRELIAKQCDDALTVADGMAFEQELFGSDEARYKYTSYAIVRNPWDRVVSAWRHFVESGAFVGPLRAFLEERWWLNNGYDHWAHMLPCSWWTHQDGELKVDRVLRFEQFDKSARVIADAFGVDVEEMPHRNQTRRRGYVEYYGDSLRDVVGEIMRSDVDEFDYSF